MANKDAYLLQLSGRGPGSGIALYPLRPLVVSSLIGQHYRRRHAALARRLNGLTADPPAQTMQCYSISRRAPTRSPTLLHVRLSVWRTSSELFAQLTARDTAAPADGPDRLRRLDPARHGLWWDPV